MKKTKYGDNSDHGNTKIFQPVVKKGLFEEVGVELNSQRKEMWRKVCLLG